MLAIIISACMVNDPSVCRDYKIQIEEAMDATQCAMHAAPYFVPWADEHPGWEIKRWHCGSVSEDKI